MEIFIHMNLNLCILNLDLSYTDVSTSQEMCNQRGFFIILGENNNEKNI